VSERVLADGSEPRSPKELLDFLHDRGLVSRTHEHPPVFTVEEAKALRGSLEGAHSKNLFVRDPKGVMWLVVALEDRPVDLRALAEQLGHKRFSFGSEDRLMRYLGVIAGAVTPFAVINDVTGAVRVALDEGLRHHSLWNFHPLDNGMTTAIAPSDMIRFLEAVDHPPRWVDMRASSG
jgi:Ala-tRNA(Pro) deacylase